MYKDGDGETPLVHKVVIDGKAFDMEPEGYDYVNGANFTYKTSLKSGDHTFGFEFSDGTNVTRAPQDGSFEGPLVNDPPVPVLKGPKKVEKGQKVKFDASASSDPDGSVAQYKFDFGDGTDSGWQNESSAKHTYKKTGKFQVKVHVRDELGGESVSVETEVKVEEASGFVPTPGALLSWLAMSLACIITSRKVRSRP
jgi:PKD repeat protein